MAEMKNKGDGDGQSDEEPNLERDTYKDPSRFTNEVIFEELVLANENLQNFMAKDFMQDAAEALKRLLDVCNFLNSENKKLKKTNEELLPKIADADEKLISAFQATASSQQTINRLKNSLEESWQKIDASWAREQDYQEEIVELQTKCKGFEQKPTEEAEDLGDLTRHRGIILRERDRLNGEVKELEKRLQLQRYYGETLEQMCQQTEEKNKTYQRQLEQMEMNENKIERKNQMQLKAIEELKESNRILLKKCDNYEKLIEEQANIIRDKGKNTEKLRSAFEKLKSNFKIYKKKFSQLKKNYMNCVSDRKTLSEKIQAILRDITMKDVEIAMKSKNLKKLQSDFDNLSTKVFKLEKDGASLRTEVAKYKSLLHTKERDIINQMREADELGRLKDLVTHERDSLRSELVKLNNSIAELRHINIMRDITIDNLHLDIRKLQLRLEETKKVIASVERERDEQIQEAELLNDKIDWYAEQVQLKADHIAELQRQLQDKHANLIKVQKLLETTNSERIMLQRSLQSCGEERSNLKNMQAVTIHQMAQLTEEISANQNKINQLHLQIDKLQKEKQELLTELRSTKKLLSSTRQELKDMKAKNEKLQKTLAEDELRFMQLEHMLEDTTKEKNLIGLQMVRRNDEISLLKERLDIVQTAVDRGGVQYNQRIEDIRLLKLEIRHLNTQRDVLKRGVAQTVRMRREIIRLRRNLDQKEIEVQALKADLRVPVNIHRWRILRGTDPERYSLVEKNRVLQKRLLMTYIEGAQREKSLQNCHQLCVSLKFFIEKLPSYKVKEDFVNAQRVLRNREKKLKALSAELVIRELEVQTRDCTIAELTANLVTVKKELFTEKTTVSKLQAKKPIPLPPGKVCTA